MSADKSFILVLDNNRINDVIRKLGKFCVNDNDFSNFNPEKFTNDSVCCIRLDSDLELEFYAIKTKGNKSNPNKSTFGLIQVWIKKNLENTQIEMWPTTNFLFKILNNSTTLRSDFIDIIKDTNGYEFNIDNGDGSFEYVFSNR
jgi:hypothetical protein